MVCVVLHRVSESELEQQVAFLPEGFSPTGGIVQSLSCNMQEPRVPNISPTVPLRTLTASVSLQAAGKGRHLQPGSMPLSKKDEGLVRLFMTACYHQWEKLPLAGKSCLETGAAHAEVQGCIRHMVV